MDDFNDILDEHAETGATDIVKNKWNGDIKKRYRVLKGHLAKISENDEIILASTSDDRSIDEVRKKLNAQIEKLKCKYEGANGLYRQTITQNRQNIVKNSYTKPETIPFQTFYPDTVNYDEWQKGVQKFVKDMNHDNAKQHFLIGKLPLDIQTQLQNHQSFEDCMQTLAHQFGDHIKNTTEQIAKKLLMALASNRLPGGFVLHVSSKARDKEKAD